MERRENIPAIVRRERGGAGHIDRIERQLQGGRVRLHRDIGRDGLASQVRAFAGVTRSSWLPR